MLNKSKKDTLDIPMYRIEQETLDARDFLKLTDTERSNIRESRIVPPKLGDANFGKIIVRYRVPTYRHRAA